MNLLDFSRIAEINAIMPDVLSILLKYKMGRRVGEGIILENYGTFLEYANGKIWGSFLFRV